MSFSANVKAELCRTQFGSVGQAIAECYGILLFCNTFSANEIRITTSSPEFAHRITPLFNYAFSLPLITVGKEEIKSNTGYGRHVFILRDNAKLAKILNIFGYDSERVLTHHINLGLLEEAGTRSSFLRGAFLAGGSITDPAKRYHIEMATSHYKVSREMMSLLIDMGFDPGSIQRSGNYILYFKQSTAIEDMLTTMGAPISAMNIMSVKVEKDLTNSINRKVNCDTANVSKTVEASTAQLDAICRLRKSGAFDEIPSKLRETAELRETYPELSLSELAEMLSPPVSKSCLSHRMKKIMEISEKYRTI